MIDDFDVGLGPGENLSVCVSVCWHKKLVFNYFNIKIFNFENFKKYFDYFFFQLCAFLIVKLDDMNESNDLENFF